MEIRIEDSECSSSDNEEFTRSEEAENCVNISVTSFENLESLEYATTVNYRGKRKYMAPDNFEDVVPIKIKALPQDLNDISISIVPLSKDNPLSASPRKWSNTIKQFVGKLPINCLTVWPFCGFVSWRVNNCKRGRPWNNIQGSKLKSFTAGPRLRMNCLGSHRCHSVHCKNVLDFGVNWKVFITKNDQVVYMYLVRIVWF